jgi:hypothetical protein
MWPYCCLPRLRCLEMLLVDLAKPRPTLEIRTSEDACPTKNEISTLPATSLHHQNVASVIIWLRAKPKVRPMSQAKSKYYTDVQYFLSIRKVLINAMKFLKKDDKKCHRTGQNALKMRKLNCRPPATKVKAGITETAWKSQLRLLVYDKKWCSRSVKRLHTSSKSHILRVQL